MSITSKLKQISVSTLEILRQNPLLVPSFFAAHWLPESAFWKQAKYWTQESAERTKQEARARFGQLPQGQRQWKSNYDWQSLEQQFLNEWETPELDLHKYFPELTYLLAGYIPGYVSSEWTLPELRELVVSQSQSDFLAFLVIENSEWDDLPLVNALGAGSEIGLARGAGPVRYLQTEEVGQIFDGLLFLSEEGFQDRYRRESEKAEPSPWVDWSEEEMLDWLTNYYIDIEGYYENTLRAKRAMLLYLT